MFQKAIVDQAESARGLLALSLIFPQAVALLVWYPVALGHPSLGQFLRAAMKKSPAPEQSFLYRPF